MKNQHKRYLRIALLGFTFGMVSDILGYVFQGWLYINYLIPAIAWPLAMAAYYRLRPRLHKVLSYLAIGIYALWTEMMAIIIGVMRYTIIGVPNLIPIGMGWMPRAILIWPLITLVFYYLSVDLIDYFKERMNSYLAEVAVVGLVILFSASFTMLYMRVLAFIL